MKFFLEVDEKKEQSVTVVCKKVNAFVKKIEDLVKIRPRGGGGTSFSAVFDYISNKMQSELIASIIILTDGYAPFPPESVAEDIPVLWLINSDITAPWGRTVRIK